MHNEPQMSEEVLAAIREQIPEAKLGPTGRFPDGKLTPQDEGELELAVGTLKGKVIMAFGTPIATLGMSPDQARGIARSLMKRATQIEKRNARGRKRRR